MLLQVEHLLTNACRAIAKTATNGVECNLQTLVVAVIRQTTGNPIAQAAVFEQLWDAVDAPLASRETQLASLAEFLPAEAASQLTGPASTQLEEAVATLQASLEKTGATVADKVLAEEIVARAGTYVVENGLSSFRQAWQEVVDAADSGAESTFARASA